MRVAWICAAAAATLVALNGCGRVEASAADPQGAIHEATVTIAGRCAGVLIEDAPYVLTAAHCVNPTDTALPIAYFDGTEAVAELASIDRDRDLALLQLPLPAPFDGLQLSETLPAVGTTAYFAGRFDRGATLQHVEVNRIGRCPSLPQAPHVLFTTLRGIPGDSGAPVVDESLNVVGLVHGGAACSIAAPTYVVPQMLRELEPDTWARAR